MSDAKYWKDITQRCVDAGLCIRCRRRKAEEGKTKCAKCNEYQANLMKERRMKWRKEGACVICGKEVFSGDYTHCTNCQIKENGRKQLRNSWV